MTDYDDLKRRLARGWNTWNYRSVLSHVRLPEGLAINLAVKEYCFGQCLRETLFGRQGGEDEVARPGCRSYDGSYTSLELIWQELTLRVESAIDGDDLLVVVTLLANPHPIAPRIIVEPGMLWNRPGYTVREGDHLVCHTPGAAVPVFATQAHADEPYTGATGAYLALPLTDAVGVCTGRQRTLEEIQAVVAGSKAAWRAHVKSFGELAETYEAVQTPLAWNTIYEPLKDRVVSPVSHLWCCWHGGYTLYCWDQYFAAAMAAIDNPDLAIANAVEITREMTPDGFVPNGTEATGNTSLDRSEPPVGAWTVAMLYRRFGCRWLVEMLFDDLLRWNRWWHETRRTPDGLLAWGSTPFTPRTGNPWESNGVGNRFGAAMESGMDNSPMYDDVPFDDQRNILRQADAGLCGLYLADCHALAELAAAIGRDTEAAELRTRIDEYTPATQTLWSEPAGIFLNRRTDTGRFSPRVSPTCTYPLFGRAATQAQAQRIVDEHLANDNSLGGQWVIPTIARNDPAFADQDYWRGRIWPPTNFLTYLGLRNYDLPAARAQLAEKSRELLLKEWRANRHVHENYHADTGEGCDKPTSDRLYHWAGLLGLMSFFEAGCFETALER